MYKNKTNVYVITFSLRSRNSREKWFFILPYISARPLIVTVADGTCHLLVHRQISRPFESRRRTVAKLCAFLPAAPVVYVRWKHSSAPKSLRSFSTHFYGRYSHCVTLRFALLLWFRKGLRRFRTAPRTDESALPLLINHRKQTKKLPFFEHILFKSFEVLI